MRVLVILVGGLGVLGCTRASNETASLDEPWIGPPPKAAEPCQKPQVASQATAPQLIAADIHLINESEPLRWIGLNAHVYELDSATHVVIDLGDDRRVKGPLWDERYWYRTKCFEDCENGSSAGRPTAVERIDRRSGERMRLGRGDYGLGRVTLVGDYVYWGVFGHQVNGGVARVRKEGGEQEDVRISGSTGGDKITKLTAYADGIVALGWESIAWIPLGSGEARYVAKGFRADNAVLDGSVIYAADQGDPYWDSKASGHIRRISLDGSNTMLAGPFKWPAGIATHGSEVYFTLRESTNIWAVSKTGGFPRVVLNMGPREPCQESKALWATDRGLIWADGGGTWSFDDRRTLHFAPWAALQHD